MGWVFVLWTDRICSKFKIETNVVSIIVYTEMNWFKMFKQNMNSDLYEEIIHEFLVPYAAEHFKLNCFLHQDNDTKHSSGICVSALEECNIKWVNNRMINFV